MLLLLLACTQDIDADGFYDYEDCEDANPAIYPGNFELCDGIDNDCDSTIDEGYDLDEDGYVFADAGCRMMGMILDCNDDDPIINPAQEEACDNLDNNCDGLIDNAQDIDQDGVSCDDCNDEDPFVSPNQAEVCDGIDNDCDTLTDEGWDHDGDGVSPCAGDCDDYNPNNAGGLEEICDGIDNNCDQIADEGFDQDGDLITTCRGDCDDTRTDVSPLLEEICDGVDNDCNPATDEAADGDLDQLSPCDGDCNDLDPNIRPGRQELCDDLDNDCDGQIETDPACWGCVETTPYFACTAERTWPQANAACEAMGMRLVSIEDSAENDLVASFSGGYLWIGLHDLNTEGSYEWVDGSPVEFTSFWSGEPNDYGGEDCIGTNYGALGYWNDFQCETAFMAFVCEP